jgi:hypothetical protein
MDVFLNLNTPIKNYFRIFSVSVSYELV